MEVGTISSKVLLNYNKEEIEKLLIEFKEYIKDYKFKINPNEELSNQKISKEANAVVFVIFGKIHTRTRKVDRNYIHTGVNGFGEYVVSASVVVPEDNFLSSCLEKSVCCGNDLERRLAYSDRV